MIQVVAGSFPMNKSKLLAPIVKMINKTSFTFGKVNGMVQGIILVLFYAIGMKL